MVRLVWVRDRLGRVRVRVRLVFIVHCHIIVP